MSNRVDLSRNSLLMGCRAINSALAKPNSILDFEGARAGLLSLFQQLLPQEFIWRALSQAEVRENNRVYHTSVVIWLMINQRLQAAGTLETAVMDLVADLPESFWPYPCKRVEMASQAGGRRLSKRTAAYNQAQQQLSLLVVEHCTDHALQQMMALASSSDRQMPAFFLDGTTMRMPHSEELVAAYPPS